jgi:hypothetical protein
MVLETGFEVHLDSNSGVFVNGEACGADLQRSPPAGVWKQVTVKALSIM